MGYFSNGTEGLIYQENYCFNCIHDNKCAVWAAHYLHNYKECNNKESILHILIPRNGTENEQCTMFVEKIRKMARADRAKQNPESLDD